MAHPGRHQRSGQGRIEPFSRICKLTVTPIYGCLLVIMLIKFDSEVGSFIMNGDIAVQLLKAMGHSGTVPSAILARDIPAALARLKAAVAASPRAATESSDSDDKDRREIPFTFHLPFVHITSAPFSAARVSRSISGKARC